MGSRRASTLGWRGSPGDFHLCARFVVPSGAASCRISVDAACLNLRAVSLKAPDGASVAAFGLVAKNLTVGNCWTATPAHNPGSSLRRVRPDSASNDSGIGVFQCNTCARRFPLVAVDVTGVYRGRGVLAVYPAPTVSDVPVNAAIRDCRVSPLPRSRSLPRTLHFRRL